MGRRAATADRRPRNQAPRAFWWAGVILLLASVWGTQWFLTRERVTEVVTGPDADSPEVVCVGHVDSEYGVTALSPSTLGRVVAITPEGTEVQAGAVLIRLDDRHAMLRVEEAKAAQSVADEIVAQARKLAELQPFKVEQQSAALAAAMSKVAAAKAQLDFRRQLKEVGNVTQSELDASAEIVKEAEQLVKVETSRKAEIDSFDPKAKIRAAELEAKAVAVKVRQAEEALADFVLKAPRAGRVLRVHVGVGDTCAPASPQPAMLFLPAGRLVVRAEIEQEFLGRAKVGMRAVIQDDSKANSHEWKGRVERLADWISRRRSIVFEPGAMNDVRTLECIVAVDVDDAPLRVGQRVRVLVYTE